MVRLLSLFALASIELVHALSVKHARVRRQDITTLNPNQIAEFTPFTYFASAAYCDPSSTLHWTCKVCNAVPDFQTMAAGGDGDGTQFWYVGFSPSLETVIVAHQGTDTHKLFAELTDINILLEPLDPTLFPGIPSDVRVHNGFALEQARTASQILATVQQTLEMQHLSTVTVVGHSLGAALALLDGVFFNLHLPEYVTVKVIGYGMPRVGNQAFADFADKSLGPNVTHVNNREDPIPVLPPMLLGYRHSSGEVHILDSGSWVACPGQDNPSDSCIVGDLKKNPVRANDGDHSGPYNGVTIGC